MKKISFAGLLIAAALALACDSAPPPQPVTTPTMASGAAKTGSGPNERAIESVRAAAIPQHKGGSFKLSDLSGKVVVVDFWGTWCPPCRKQAPQLAALNRTNINVQELAVKAALEGNRDALYQAVALDPLTAAKLSLSEIRQMVDEMVAALQPWLPVYR